MKDIIYTIFCLLFFSLVGCTTEKATESSSSNEVIEPDYSEQLQGAWETTFFNDKGDTIQAIATFEGKYMAETWFNFEQKKFYKTFGGTWEIEEDKLLLTKEFDSGDTASVGQISERVLEKKADDLSFGDDNKTWKRLDHNEPGALAGAWFFSGRERDGEIKRRKFGARRTLKILSGTRFQWVAYHVETGRFSGTGGGTYTTLNGKYVENIEFFSRDSSRVGASLPFDFEIKDGEWHHTGLNSKGNPMYEIWGNAESVAK